MRLAPFLNFLNPFPRVTLAPRDELVIGLDEVPQHLGCGLRWVELHPCREARILQVVVDLSLEARADRQREKPLQSGFCVGRLH